MQTYPTSRYRRNFLAMNFSLHHDAKKQSSPAVFAALGTMVFSDSIPSYFSHPIATTTTPYRRQKHSKVVFFRPAIGDNISSKILSPLQIKS